MELLFEYGLFLAKTITLVLAIIACFIAVAAMRNQNKEESNINIKNVNEQYKEMESTLKAAVLSEDELKTLAKNEKKAAKLKKKELKKQADTESSDKRVFIATFNGDIKASDTEGLRDIITMVLSVAKSSDEFVLKLESQGGMVHSYGYASSQLTRVKNANIPLTVCIDMVAASGGYMMACVADKILAAPFAVLGSIGVVAQLPNFHKLLKKHDIDYETLTAGEHKRTLTMFGENTDKGREKFVEDLEDTHKLFQEFITENRPKVDVSSVATGEVWYGKRALDHHLLDEIKTSDDYIFELCKEFDVYEINYEHKKTLIQKLGIGIQLGVDNAIAKILQVVS